MLAISGGGLPHIILLAAMAVLVIQLVKTVMSVPLIVILLVGHIVKMVLRALTQNQVE